MFLRLESALDRLATYSQSDVKRIPTGLSVVDRLVGGPAPGELCCIVGRSYTGKSMIAQNIIVNNPKIPSIFFSQEMSDVQCLIRMYSIQNATEASALQHAVERGQLPDDLYSLAEQFPVHAIVDTAGIGFDYMTQMMNAYRTEFEVQPRFVVLDYLELMSTEGDGEPSVAVKEKFVRLRQWAKEQAVAVFVVHQGNKESKVWEPPTEDGARYAGFTEADIYLGVWRPHLNPEASSADRNFYSNKLKINVLKNRPFGYTKPDGFLFTISPSLRLLEGDMLPYVDRLQLSGGDESPLGGPSQPSNVVYLHQQEADHDTIF